MSELRIGMIGLGLIGGSIAKAIREAFPSCTLTAWDVDEAALRLARKEGIVDIAADGVDEAFSNLQYIFLCGPVMRNIENLPLLAKVISPDCTLTDVGSVKTGIHEAVEKLGLGPQFIGGHPMAGSERFGYANSKASLLENAYYILTPTGDCSPGRLAAMENLVRHMRALPMVLGYSQHDFSTAAISHLPHLIASALVNLVRDQDDSDETMKQIAAGGFKDITRIASSNPAMWQQICLSNNANLRVLLDRYIEALERIREQVVLEDAEGLYDFFDRARIYRDSFVNASSGPIKRSYEITVDIADRPGALAQIVAVLAENGINIKNVGILHNREHESGVLKVEFPDEKSLIEAKEILWKRRYYIYEKMP